MKLFMQSVLGTLCVGLLMFAFNPRLAVAEEKKNEFPAEWFWGKPEQRAQQDEMLGKPMPELQLSDWKNGEVKSDRVKDKVVIVDFWATWCGPCLASIPHNNEMLQKYKDRPVALIGICGSSHGQEKMEAVVKEKGIEYPVAKDATQASAKTWRVMWWPTYGVVDRSGKLRALGLKPGYVEKVVDKLLAEKGGEQAGVGDQAQLAAAKESNIKNEWLEGDENTRARFNGMEGKAPPALSVKDWTNGQETKLDALRGKVVMIDFWATWCGPCIASIPHTNELQEKYKDKGLVVIGVCNSRGAEKMADTVKEKGIKYTVAADVDGKTDAAYKVDSYPDYYFIDRAGNLRICDCKNGSIEDAIKVLLDEPGPTASAR